MSPNVFNVFSNFCNQTIPSNIWVQFSGIAIQLTIDNLNVEIVLTSEFSSMFCHNWI